MLHVVALHTPIRRSIGLLYIYVSGVGASRPRVAADGSTCYMYVLSVIHSSIHLSVDVSAYLSIYQSMYVSVYVYVCMCVYVCLFVVQCVCACVHAHVFVCSYAPTHANRLLLCPSLCLCL